MAVWSKARRETDTPQPSTFQGYHNYRVEIQNKTRFSYPQYARFINESQNSLAYLSLSVHRSKPHSIPDSPVRSQEQTSQGENKT